MPPVRTEALDKRMGKWNRHREGIVDALPLIEGMAALIAVYLAVALRFGLNPADIRASVGAVSPEGVVFALINLLAVTGVGLYNHRLRDDLEAILVRIAVALVFTMLGVVLAYYSFAGIFLGRGVLALALLLQGVALIVTRTQLPRLGRSDKGKRRILVLGAGRRAHVLEHLRRRTDLIGVRTTATSPSRVTPCPCPNNVSLSSIGRWRTGSRITASTRSSSPRTSGATPWTCISCSCAGVAASSCPTWPASTSTRPGG